MGSTVYLAEELVLNASCNVSVSIISAGFRFCGRQYITGLDKHHQNKFVISSLNKQFLCSLSNVAPARGYFYICLNHHKMLKLITHLQLLVYLYD